ncbi:MAG TPA: YetF domain-containing protein [Polyangiaceae bacterium]|nr:YetF domain-containing protein [Polyangiaceae bacterium]
MKPEDFRLLDLTRLVWGNTPWTFAIEVALRILVLYLILVIAMRAMGRRMASQLSRNELIAMVSLAAGIGPAIQAPDRGLIPPAFIAVWVVLVQRAISAATVRSYRIENLLQGEPATLVSDGTMDLRELQRNRISRNELFAQVRSIGALQLGAIERIYFEPNGTFTVIQSAQPTPGLTVVPSWDEDLKAEQRLSEDRLVCHHCGKLADRQDTSRACPVCKAKSWQPAVEA